MTNFAVIAYKPIDEIKVKPVHGYISDVEYTNMANEIFTWLYRFVPGGVFSELVRLFVYYNYRRINNENP